MPKIAIFGMGGTIASTPSSNEGIIPTLELKDFCEKNIPEAKHFQFDLVSLSMKDSSRVLPNDWLNLTSEINSRLNEDVLGAIVTHGTDTMEEAAYFIDRTLLHSQPVCFVGAQQHATHPSSDGPCNLRDALTVISDPKAMGIGVTLVMNSCIFPAKGLRKVNAQTGTGFQCMNSALLGRIAHGVPYWFPRSKRRPPLTLRQSLPRVDLITEYPGSDGEHLRTSVRHGSRGIVIQALGSGNVGESLYEAILMARKNEIPIVISTRMNDGGANPIYGGPGGGYTLKKAGCLFAPHHTSAQARIELMVALAAGVSPSDLEGLFSPF